MQDIKGNNHRSNKEDLVFFIRIQYRCNSSWQGTIQWMDGRKTSTFRSVLELANLIDDARRQAGGEAKIKHPKWEEKEEVS